MASDPPQLRLASFIRQNVEDLLRGWDEFAKALAGGANLDAAALRDHAREILLAVADDMVTVQSEQEQIDKSQGLRPESSPALGAAAASHGIGRLAQKFSLNELAVELRALRASVLRALARAGVNASINELTRFNEAIDQVLAGSIASYSEKLERTKDLERESELRRLLLLRTQAVQEEERRRIARDLHDSVGQKVIAMSLCLASLRQHPMDEEARGQLDKLSELVASSDAELDKIVFQLRPMALEDCGLADALEQHVKDWSMLTGVRVDMATEGVEGIKQFPQHIEATVFRVIQEALNNVAKHARARNVSITVHRRHDWITASVEDDGVGLATTETELRPPGLGVAGMKERIQALGGQFTLESSEGAGTTVLLRLPLTALDQSGS